MEWTARGIVLGTRRHGESSAVVEIFTRERGRHLGLVRGGRSKRQRVVLQAGNLVTVTWRARLEEHLGHLAVELDAAGASRLMESASALYGFAVAAAHVRLLAERDPHERIYDLFLELVAMLPDPLAGAAALASFELEMLADLGFGLDLESCAVTGEAEALCWVSPRSGRAVGAAAGAPYADRLLPLPPFLHGTHREAPPSAADIRAAFALTGFFLERHVLEPRGLKLPPERQNVLRGLV